MTRRPSMRGEGGSKRADALRWLAAGAVALGLHAGAALLILRDARPEPLDVGGGDAVAVELDPVEGEAAKPDETPPAAPADEAQTAAADAAAAEASRAAPQPPADVSTPQPPPIESPPPDVHPPETPVPPPTTAAEPPPSEAAVDRPSPPPEPPSPSPQPPEPPVVQAPQFQAPPVQAMQSSAASSASAAAEDAALAVRRLSSARAAAWRGKLLPHLNRFRRALLGVGDGTVRVAFTIDAGGRITAVSTAASSGNPALDEAARALVRRASPFPAPPAGLSGPALSFVVPIHNGGPRP